MKLYLLETLKYIYIYEYMKIPINIYIFIKNLWCFWFLFMPLSLCLWWLYCYEKSCSRPVQCALCALCNGQRAIVIGFSYPHSSIETCKYCCWLVAFCSATHANRYLSRAHYLKRWLKFLLKNQTFLVTLSLKI